jgi:hypothetical protein
LRAGLSDRPKSAELKFGAKPAECRSVRSKFRKNEKGTASGQKLVRINSVIICYFPSSLLLSVISLPAYYYLLFPFQLMMT